MNTSAPRIEFSPLTGAIRALAMDAVQQANSGHPGMPMGMAEIAEVVWRKNLSHNPANPAWANRDRFVLSNGHGSMLHYALLHLTGYDLPLEELKNFRQLGSKTPGHPEYGHTAGVETTTGPLGQGIGNAVGMALAEQLLAAEFNREGFPVVDHYSYTFLGDGCMMEGISHEVCSLAGVWKLSKLIAFYDDNGISIDGHVKGWFGDDTPKRFEAYGWNVIRDVDGHDVDAVDRAIAAAKAQNDKPTLICCKTVIGKGSPNKAGTHDVHGAPLGKDEVAATRAALGITDGAFEVPQDVRAVWDARGPGAERQAEWNGRFAAYRAAYPELAAEFVTCDLKQAAFECSGLVLVILDRSERSGIHAALQLVKGVFHALQLIGGQQSGAAQCTGMGARTGDIVIGESPVELGGLAQPCEFRRRTRRKATTPQGQMFVVLSHEGSLKSENSCV